MGQPVQRYSTVEEDGDRPYGSGCGGVVYLLLERSVRPRGRCLPRSKRAFDLPHSVWQSRPSSMASKSATSAFAGLPAVSSQNLQTGTVSLTMPALKISAETSLKQAIQTSMEKRISIHGSEVRVWARELHDALACGSSARATMPGPLLSLAKELGWFVAVADGRSQLATRERFPLADEVNVLQIQELPQRESARDASGAFAASFQPHDAAVILETHSFEQDSRILASLLAREHEPRAYIGVLGPQRRTRELLVEVARLRNLPPAPASTTAAWIGAPALAASCPDGSRPGRGVTPDHRLLHPCRDSAVFHRGHGTPAARGA